MWMYQELVFSQHLQHYVSFSCKHYPKKWIIIAQRIDIQYLLYEQSGIQYIYHEFNIYPNETFFNFITNMRMSMTAVA